MFKKRNRPPEPTMSRDEALALTPVPNPEITEEGGDEGPLRLVYHVSYKPWYGRMAEKWGVWDGSPMIRRLELDTMGTAVWRLIDGKRTVADIVATFANEYALLDREAEMSVTTFVRELGKRSIIALR